MAGHTARCKATERIWPPKLVLRSTSSADRPEKSRHSRNQVISPYMYLSFLSSTIPPPVSIQHQGNRWIHISWITANGAINYAHAAQITYKVVIFHICVTRSKTALIASGSQAAGTMTLMAASAQPASSVPRENQPNRGQKHFHHVACHLSGQAIWAKANALRSEFGSSSSRLSPFSDQNRARTRVEGDPRCGVLRERGEQHI